MASKEANISALYTELSRLGQNGEYERAIKTTNKILQQSPDEEEAFHCKIVCLIQLSKFHDALQNINKQPKLSKNLIFEKAYCQYRLNQPGEAFNTVNAAPNLDQKLSELKAQILYRLEKYDECYETYKSIIKNSSDDYEDEREANLSAVLANLYMEKTKKELPKLREHTFELTYNAACHLVGKGLYIEAEKKLKAAEKLCRETLEEDGTPEEDIEAEIGIIKGQLAFCLQMQGRDKEAQSIYNALLKSKPTDIGLVAVASNNSVTINRDENVFDSKKKMKSATTDDVEHKLTKAQRKSIALNQCLLTIYTNQIEHGRQLCAKLTETYPDCAADAALIQATQMTRDNRSKEAVGYLKKFAENHKDRELELKLACVQLLLTAGEKKEACRILESMGDSVNRAGIISALVALYLSESNLDKASLVFKNAVDWYKNRASNQGDLSALWRQAADFHLRNGDPQVAANSLEELLRLNPNDNKTLAQLVTAYAMFDPVKAQAVSKRLPPFNVPRSADIEMLEGSNWLMSTKIIKKVNKVEASPKPGALNEDELIHKKKKKNRKRKGKLPKNYEEGVMPDPERWLPKYERTGYKRKKDRRNKDIGKGTQGAATGASDMYDITKMPSHAKNTSNPSSPAAESQGPRQQQRRFQQKKKKKGGKF
ncbi:UNVERIFIED_CONTAM: hypothetical protein PYX00_007502 [Menopon gallinae]|uniref:Signal recognition particle subunit SRP72 n=1 Tax=Menopon gallinae TaxID=328185 RepID=A0AAW2HKA2_9NEOP